MRPARPIRWHMRGSHPRSEFAPEDLMRGVERDRTRFLPEVIVDPTTWEIARLVARTTRGHHGEGLRGLYVHSSEGAGTTYWWPARLASHHQGRLLLRVGADRNSPNVHEVEVNLAEDGDLYLQFGKLDDEWRDVERALVAHRSIGPLVDGCLSRNGRKIRIDHNGRLRITDRPIDSEKEVQRRRHLAWSAFADEVDAWARTRRRTLPDGSPRPAGTIIANMRAWLAMQVGWMSSDPLPTRRITRDGVVLEWRGTDRYAALTFEGTTMSCRSVVRGEVLEHGPVEVGTRRRMRTSSPRIDGLWDYRCALEERP